jgi:3'-phosphoadenosine 5'-phosphosulfate sulfotransferase (PAPS reductase)/FAD synthetase
LTRKVDRALSVIGRWLEATDRCAYGSVSGGKDSLVMAHLIRQVWPSCPFAWVNQGPLAEWPDCIDLLHHLQGQGWNIIELCPPRSLLKLYQDYGIPLDGTMATGLDKRINAALMYGPLDDYQEAHGVRGYAWGLRKESRGRAMYLKGKGELYQRKDGLWVCSPVGFWSTQDIWCYIDSHQLPYPAMYDRDRLTVRNGPPIGTTGVNWGRLSDLRRHHPEFWAEFCKHFPEVADHG